MFKLNHPVILLIYVALSCFLSSCKILQDPSTNATSYMGQRPPGARPEVFAPNIVSVKGRFEAGFTMSPNNKIIAFGVVDESDGELTGIYMMNFSKGKWSSPDKTVLPDNMGTYFPMFGPDGKHLYYVKHTDTTETDLWVAEYRNDQIVKPRSINTIINSTSREAGHGRSFKGAIYFTSNRDDKHQCCGDVYRSEVPHTTIFKVNELSTEFDEESLYLSPEEDYIIIQAWKKQFKSKHDLYISYRTVNSHWTRPERFDILINSSNIEQRPFISPNKKYLFFNRTIDIPGAVESDLYWVSTKSIFQPYVFNPAIGYKVFYNHAIDIKLPTDLFKDIDDRKLSYMATMDNGSPLPAWIKFNSGNLTFSGIYNTLEVMKVLITATDSYGNKGKFQFSITPTDNKNTPGLKLREE